MEGIPDIANFRKRLEEVDKIMAAPDFYQDARRAAEIGREHQKLSQLIEHYEKLEKISTEINDHEAIVKDSNADSELKELAEEELPSLKEDFEETKKLVLLAMIPPDSSDSRNTIMEIRAGAGGDEASLFAADLFRMYSRYAENNKLKLEMLGAHPSEAGGYKEVHFLVSGEDVFKVLKYESGVHRVQRIPTTETNGRIHTSTVTVAVLPEAQEVDIEINPADLDITVCRASGPGGQGVNTTDSAVQIIHKPTNIMVNCADERSQLKNKNKAMTVLRAKLLEKKQAEEDEKYAANRRNQVGTGDRSERIRTYNFPQSRLTDHRIGLSLHSLPEIMEGELSNLLSALESAFQEKRLNELLEKELPQ